VDKFVHLPPPLAEYSSRGELNFSVNVDNFATIYFRLVYNYSI